MAIVETMEIRFQADLSKLSRQLALAAAQLEGLGDAAETVQKNLEAAQSGCAAAGRGMAQALIGAMHSGRTQALSEGRSMALAAAEGMRGAGQSAASSAGRLLAGRFSSGVSSGSGQASAAAMGVAAAATFSGNSEAAFSAGASLSQGFANGILSRKGAVIAAANQVAAAATSRIRSALKIHSPSRVTFELGESFGAGFAGGVTASIRQVQAGARAMSDGALSEVQLRTASPASEMDLGGMADTVQRAVQSALGGTNLVVPLHVDGVKLGEASIRGINRVTRSAGRLMLEI